jgi:hypothetical protein
MKQLHKRMTTEEVVVVLEKYLSQEVELGMCLRLLKIERRQFFKLLNKYRTSPNEFTIAYERKTAPRRIDEKAEKLLHKELAKEKGLIENKDTPIRHYNYSYIQQLLLEKQGVKISLPTIIDRAKKMIATSQNLKRKTTTGKSSRTMSAS